MRTVFSALVVVACLAIGLTAGPARAADPVVLSTGTFASNAWIAYRVDVPPGGASVDVGGRFQTSGDRTISATHVLYPDGRWATAYGWGACLPAKRLQASVELPAAGRVIDHRPAGCARATVPAAPASPSDPARTWSS